MSDSTWDDSMRMLAHRVVVAWRRISGVPVGFLHPDRHRVLGVLYLTDTAGLTDIF